MINHDELRSTWVLRMRSNKEISWMRIAVDLRRVEVQQSRAEEDRVGRTKPNLKVWAAMRALAASMVARKESL